MYLSATDKKDYPNLDLMLQLVIPKLANDSKVKKALKKWGEFTDDSLSIAVSYGSGPRVVITKLSNACGEFTPNASSNEVRLHKSLAKQFEKKFKPPFRLALTLLSTIVGTLLHELAHWGDDQDGADISGEEGEEFEKEAFNIAQHLCALNFEKLKEQGVSF